MTTERKHCECNHHLVKNMPTPLFRLVCHCKTCQEFFDYPYNDECTFLLKECSHLDLSNIEFKSYQEGFSPIKRGTCLTCGKVAYCKVKLGPLTEFLMVSSDLLDAETIPSPFAHIYYGSRASDISDTVKKIEGHTLSQLSIQWAVFKSLFKKTTGTQR